MSLFDLVVRNGTVVTASDAFIADIGIVQEKIVALGCDLAGHEELDASGKYVFPGLIDAHVHMQLPVGDMVSADDFTTGSIAAACGGTTTLVDFVSPRRGQPLAEAVAARRAEADGHVAVDYALHLTAVDASTDVLDSLPALADLGYTTLKMYTTYSAMRIDDQEMLIVLHACRENGILPLVHAENHGSIEYLRHQLPAEGKTGPQWHPHSRPHVVEVEAVHRVLCLAGLVDCPLYIVHLSCAMSLDLVQRARVGGQTVYAEACIPHLLLTDQEYQRPGFASASFVLSPPLRSDSDREALWRALADGRLNAISTDHCPWTQAQRERGRQDLAQIPNGLPGVETRAPLIFHKGVNQGRLSLQQFVNLCATAPAQLMGLYPRKGTIAPGSDADLVIFDPAQEWTLHADQLHQNTDHCPYEGWQGRGWPQTVLLRGQVIVRHDRFVGRAAGHGKFIARRRIMSKRYG